MLTIGILMTSCIDQDVDRRLAGSVRPSQEWLEIEPDPPLKTSRQVQTIVLVIAEPFEPDLKSWGLRLESGVTSKPEVQLVDRHGSVFELNSPAFIGQNERAFSMLDLPTDREYTKVRIRSDHPFDCERVIWRCHDMK